MSRRLFEHWLAMLQENVLTLGALAEQSISQSVAFLQQRDFEGARELIQQDHTLDTRRYAIEAEALTLIVTQQPIARDMRTIAAAIFIANELERIGDYAKGIARVNIRIGDEALIRPLVDIPSMLAAAQKMLHRSLQAYVQCDADLARAVIADDDTVDKLYNHIYAELMTRIIETPARLCQANLLLMVAHNLERTADRATNICERVIYVATGELQDTGGQDDAL